MKNNPYDRLIYYPVAAEEVPLLLKYITSFMLNVFRKLKDKPLEMIRYKKDICFDSGGLKIFNELKKGKRVIVGPMLRIRNTRSALILGTIDICMIYRRTNSTRGLLIDWPVNCDDSDWEYHKKKLKSRKARDQMLGIALYLCPDTELVIVLQPRNPLEIKDYFSYIRTPYVDIYAYPIRDFRNKPKDALGNAYILSFLHSVGIKKVHFLGSSAPPVIFVLAQALSLDMFDILSFDSKTWDRMKYKQYKFLDPNNLSSIHVKGQINPNDVLRTGLNQNDDFFKTILDTFNPGEEALAKYFLGLNNIREIERFKNIVLDLAMEDSLRDFIYSNNFQKYGNSRDSIMEAFDLLEESKEYGHEYVEKKYGSKIRDLYS